MSEDLRPADSDRDRRATPRGEDAAALAALVAQWLAMLPARHGDSRGSAHGAAGVREAAAAAGTRLLEEIAHSIAELSTPPSGACEFSIELRTAGVIDGRVVVRPGGTVNMALRPRSRVTAEFLAERRERLQRRASLNAGVEVLLDIEHP
jgi:hypothetical protein